MSESPLRRAAATILRPARGPLPTAIAILTLLVALPTAVIRRHDTIIAASLLGVAAYAAVFIIDPLGAVAGTAGHQPRREAGAEESPQQHGGYSPLTVLRRLAAEVAPMRRRLIALVLVTLAATPLALLTPLSLKIVIDSVLGHHPAPGFVQVFIPGGAHASNTAVLVFAAILFVVVDGLIYLRSLGEWVLTTSISEQFLLQFRAKLFRHVQRLSLSYHDSRGTTDSTYRIQYDAQALSSAVVGLAPIVTAALTLASMMYVTARIDLTLAIVAILVTPVLFGVVRFYGRRMRDRWMEVKDYESSAMSVVQETLGAMRVVKAFGQEDREQERFIRRSTLNVRGQIRLAILGGAFDLAVGLVLAVGGGVVLLIGAQHVESGVLTTGELILVMSYLTQLYQPLQTVSKQFATLQGALASGERVFSVLDHAPEVVERPHARPLKRASGAIAFENVSFSYGGHRLQLNGVSFEIAPATTVGIAGMTGAGKTTLVNLLTRFYDPTDGRVLLDGVDLRDYRLADLRNQFALVLQEPVLFSTSIAENIAYARPDATEEEVVEAARAAGAHDFITLLVDGYDTEVGERGVRLSGGERQRISLARAFLKDAPILILDEPTSSVDVKTEATIMEAMSRLMVGRTSFMIAHRTSTLERCDVLFTIHDGRLESIRRHPSSLTAHDQVTSAVS